MLHHLLIRQWNSQKLHQAAHWNSGYLLYMGDEILPTISHEIRIPIKQPVITMECHDGSRSYIYI